ncbi:retrovirus-related pol polyprotein from transposon TNT 1-94 [Tanacetum coccineum]
MKDVFESTESEIDELEKQNDLLKDQLLKASLKHDVELCVLLNHECIDKILNAELQQVKKKSFEIQEGLQARIKILEKDVQRCQKQSVDFELQLQHEKEKHKWDSTSKNKNTNPLDYSWISKLEKLENENMSLDFQVQSLIKERDNVKLEYQKLFDLIKKTRIFYLPYLIKSTRWKKVEKDKSVNTKFDKTNGYQSLLCVTPLNKHALKKTDVPKIEQTHVVSKPVTLQTSSTKQTGANQKTNVIRPGMYRVVTKQESQTNKTKSALSSTRMNATSKVRRPMSRDSHVAHSVLDNSKKAAKNVAVYVKKNKPKLNVRSNVRRPSSTNSRTSKSSETTFVAPKTRFSEKETQSKTLDTILSFPNLRLIVEKVPQNAKENSDSFLVLLTNGLIKAYDGDTHLLRNVIEKIHGHRFALEMKIFTKATAKAMRLYNMAIHYLSCERESNLYTISISDMATSSPICLMSKATSTKSWLRHRRLSRLNFGTINDLTRLDLVDGLPKFKYERITYKDETPEIIKIFTVQAQLNYKAKVCMIRTDNGTEFKNTSLKAHYEKLGIMQQFSIARTPQQNGVVERRNRTLVEAARTMLIFSRLPEFLWAEAVATTCFTQNRSIIHTRYKETPRTSYGAVGETRDIASLHVLAHSCYPTNDCDESFLTLQLWLLNMTFRTRTSTIQTYHNSLAEPMNIPSKEDLDNLFGPMFEEYFEKTSSDTTINSATQPTQVHEDSSSTSSIFVDAHEAPPVVTTSDE